MAMTAKDKVMAAKAREDRMAEAGRVLQSVLSSPRRRSPLGTIEIEDGIPIPRAFAGSNKFPFAKLEVGQSFFVPAGEQRQSFSSVVRYNKTLAPKRFTCRKWDQDGVAGFRVWRIA